MAVIKPNQKSGGDNARCIQPIRLR